MATEEQMRITVTIDKSAGEKIQELADRMKTSQSRMASLLLESGLEDNEWIIKVVTSKVFKQLEQALLPKGTRQKKR